MVKLASVLLFLLLPCVGIAQTNIGIDFGPARFTLNWQDSLELKWDTTTWEVQGGLAPYFYGQTVGYGSLQANVSSRVATSATIRSEEILTPFSVGGQVFDEKKGGQKGGKKEDEVVEVGFRSQTVALWATSPYRYGIAPLVRAEVLSLNLSACGKVASKQVSVEESFSRWYPAVGLEYRHQYAVVQGAVGPGYTFLKAGLEWPVYPDITLTAAFHLREFRGGDFRLTERGWVFGGDWRF